jgi:hypothetical protein
MCARARVCVCVCVCVGVYDTERVHVAGAARRSVRVCATTARCLLRALMSERQVRDTALNMRAHAHACTQQHVPRAMRALTDGADDDVLESMLLSADASNAITPSASPLRVDEALRMAESVRALATQLDGAAAAVTPVTALFAHVGDVYTDDDAAASAASVDAADDERVHAVASACAEQCAALLAAVRDGALVPAGAPASIATTTTTLSVSVIERASAVRAQLQSAHALVAKVLC